MKNFINLKDIPTKDLRKIIIDADDNDYYIHYETKKECDNGKGHTWMRNLELMECASKCETIM